MRKLQLIIQLTDRIQIKQIDEEWLKNEKDQSYDGIFCSNVIDVVPFEMAESIVKELSRLLTNDGLAIISFNFFMNLKAAQERGFTVKDKQVYINGVLRLLSLTDEEWITLLGKYFIIEKLDYFS